MSGQIPLDFHMQVSGDSEVRAKFDQTGDVIEETGERTDKAAQSAGRAFENYSKAAGSFSLAASGVTSLYFQYDNLEKSQLRIDKAQATLTSSQASLASAQNTLNGMVEKGISSGPQYEAALLRLQSAQARVANATQDVSMAQGDLSEAQLGFALGVVPGVFSAVTGLREGISTLKDTQILSRVATALGIPVTLADAGAKGTQAAATGAAATATGGLTTATRLLHLAMGPVGIAILGISTFMALFATNAFGVRDAINAAGKAIGDALPILRPLLDTLAGIANTLFPQAAEEAQSFGDTASTSLSSISVQMPELSATTLTASADINAGFDSVTQKSQEMQELTTASLGLMTEEVGTSITTQKASFTDLGKAATSASNTVSKSFDKAATSAEKAADKIVKAAKKAASAMASMGISSGSSTSRSSSGEDPSSVGFDRAREITLVAPELDEITIAQTAGGSSGGSKSIEITVVSELDGIEIARSVNKLMAREFT